MARRTFSPETKQEILNGLRNGENKAALSSRLGISIVTVYNYAKSLSTETVGVNAGNPDVAVSATPAVAQTVVAAPATPAVAQTVVAAPAVARKSTKRGR